MGKARILDEFGDGEYLVSFYNDNYRTTLKIGLLNELIAINTEDIADAVADKVTEEALRSEKETALTIAITDYNACIALAVDDCGGKQKALATATAEFHSSADEVLRIQAELSNLKVLADRYSKEKALLEAIPPDEVPMTLWCIDRTLKMDVGLIVATIDIFDFSTKQYKHFMQPGTCGNDNTYNNNAGKTSNILSSSGEGAMLNYYMRGPLMAWSPDYRLATVSSVNEGTVTVLYDLLIDEDGVSFNTIDEEHTELPSLYMNCDSGNPFSAGDKVIVSCCGDKFFDAAVIGFQSNPKVCERYLVAQLFSTSDGVYFDQYIISPDIQQKLVNSYNVMYRTSANCQTVTRVDSVSCYPILNIVYGVDAVEYTAGINIATLAPTPKDSLGHYHKINVFADSRHIFEIPVVALADMYGGFHFISPTLIIYYRLQQAAGSVTVTKFSYDYIAKAFATLETVSYLDADIADLEVVLAGYMTAEKYLRAVASKASLVPNKDGTSTVFFNMERYGDYSFAFRINDDNISAMSISLIQKLVSVAESSTTVTVAITPTYSGHIVVTYTWDCHPADLVTVSSGSYDVSYSGTSGHSAINSSGKAIAGTSYHPITDEYIDLIFEQGVSGSIRESSSDSLGGGRGHTSTVYEGAVLVNASTENYAYSGSSSGEYGSCVVIGGNMFVGSGRESSSYARTAYRNEGSISGSSSVTSSSTTALYKFVVLDLSRKLVYTESMEQVSVRKGLFTGTDTSFRRTTNKLYYDGGYRTIFSSLVEDSTTTFAEEESITTLFPTALTMEQQSSTGYCYPFGPREGDTPMTIITHYTPDPQYNDDHYNT